MKMALLALSFLASSTSADVCAGLEKKACEDTDGCVFDNPSKVCSLDHVSTDQECHERHSNDCEIDDKCVRVKGVCEEVNRGSGLKGDACVAFFSKASNNPNDDEMLIVEVEGAGCASGYACELEDVEDATPDVNITGSCQATGCIGKKVPGNCNGNGNLDQCDARTERVTICHRTCSEKNPWVRITIDNDAWSGAGCGHQREHDIRMECSKYEKNHWAAWKPDVFGYKDYLLKYHGTREEVADSLYHNKNEIKAYWRKWEPACPYVRYGACCEEGNPENPCCGDPAFAPRFPKVQVKKLAGAPGQCSGDMTGLEDELYTLPEANAPWSYCYKVTVPISSTECIVDMTLDDESAGGPGTVQLDGIILCPGDSHYIEGPTNNNGENAPEGPIDAVVTGWGKDSGTDVNASDNAAVNPPTPELVPFISVEKYAGAVDHCNKDKIDLMTSGEYVLPGTSAPWSYCYVISIPEDSDECLIDISLTDYALGGIGDWISNEPIELCPGETIYISGPANENGANVPSPPVQAVGIGTGKQSGYSASDISDASVVAPTPQLVPKIQITKFAGPAGDCGEDMGDNVKAVIYALPHVDGQWAYCYKVTVPEGSDGSEECVVDITVNDPAPGGIGLNVPVDTDVLCPGESIYVSGDPQDVSGLPEGPIEASVNGKGEQSQTEVNAADDVEVIPPYEEPVVTPTIEFVKYAGPTGKCGEDMSVYADDVYTLPSSSSEWIYCYKISIPVGEGECIIDVTLTDAAGGGIGDKVPVGGKLCPGDTRYATSGVKAASLAPEGPVYAVVEGYGEKSGDRVTEEDDASVIAAVEDDKEEEVVGEEPPTEVETSLVPRGECPPVELYAVNGVQVKKGSAGNFGSASNFPITVLNQDTQTVTFELCPNEVVYTGFLEDSHYKCFGSDSTSGCETYTADCLTEGKFAVVDLHMLSPVTGDEALVTVPECCIPEQPASAVYVFVLECVPC